jgi:hypothetical protein
MTIQTWFFTFGFKIVLKDWMKYEGYTEENMTNELREQFKDEGDDIVFNWFYDEKINGYVLNEKFQINGVDFIARGFTHDKKKDSKNIIIGIDLGEMDRWSGKGNVQNYINCEEQIKVLIKDEKIRNLILSAQDNCTSYSLIGHGVEDPKYPSFSITPTVYITQNYCDCCS